VARAEDITTLKQFYGLMSRTRDVRVGLVRSYLSSGAADPGGVASLRDALSRLEVIPQGDSGRRVTLDGSGTIDLDLGYEIGEMVKDLLFFEEGEEALSAHLASLHPGFAEHVARGREALGGVRFNCFVTDRDGTVSNYCARYRSSIQSAYNAVFLARFVRKCTGRAVLLTSAPLAGPGVLDVSVDPPGTFIYAASKAREFVDSAGERHTFPVDPGQQAKLDALNERLAELVRRPAYEKFALIGSGLQLKFGQTTISRQDICRSVDEGESAAFLKLVEEAVRELDPEGTCFAMEDTGLDVEIILTLPGGAGGPARDFDKGDGLLFLDRELGLGLDRGPHLVCGDTSSDLRMLAACLERTADVRAAFVARNEEVAAKAREMSPDVLIFPETDVLVATLDALSRTGGGDA
jgi:hypothetical protein